MLKKTVNLFGLNISDISYARAMELAKVGLLSGESRVFFTPNLEMLETARKNKEIRNLLNSASVLLPDGVGLLLASRMVDTPIYNKVPGIDFGEGLISLAEKENKKVFLLGGRNGVAKKAAKKLLKKHPDLHICGIHSGYFNGEEESKIIRKIKRAEPDILIVCMGFPRQESFVEAHKEEFSQINIVACLGGALDVWSGRKARAPHFVRKINLEWAWRTVTEPQRIVRVARSLPTLGVALAEKTKKLLSHKSIKT